VLALAADTPWVYDRSPAGIRRSDLGRFYFYRSVVAVIDAELGMAREVAEAGARFTTIHPKFLADVAAELIKRNCRPRIGCISWRALREAGLAVPESSTVSKALASPDGRSDSRAKLRRTQSWRCGQWFAPASAM
jgi:hypothetical protein